MDQGLPTCRACDELTLMHMLVCWVVCLMHAPVQATCILSLGGGCGHCLSSRGRSLSLSLGGGRRRFTAMHLSTCM